MLRRFLGIATAIAIAAPAQAADWVAIGGPDSGAVWYMDGSRITLNGDRVHAWVKIDASHDSTVKYREEMVLYSALCGTQQIKTLSITQYDSYGKVIYSNSDTDSTYGTYGYRPVTPETMGETVLKVACAVAKGD